MSRKLQTLLDDLPLETLLPTWTSLETLFIFGTNRQALQTVIEQLDQVKGEEVVHELALEVNREAVDDHPLFVPVYRETERMLMEQRDPGRFELAEEELDLLSSYVDYLGDDRLLLALHNVALRDIRLLRQCLDEPRRYFNTRNGRRYGNLYLLLSRLFRYFNVVPRELDHFKPLEDEIQHFRHIKVLLQDITELEEKLKKVKDYPTQARELRGLYGKIPPEEYEERRKYISEVDATSFATPVKLSLSTTLRPTWSDRKTSLTILIGGYLASWTGR